MKILFKFGLNISILITIYLVSEYMIQFLSLENQLVAQSVMLFKYGGATGFFVLIIFVLLLQFEGLKSISKYQPKLTSFIKITYILFSFAFLITAIIHFDMLFILMLALIFMMMTSILDYVKEKIIDQHENHSQYPKKTM